jgi:hypothetical protein
MAEPGWDCSEAYFQIRVKKLSNQVPLSFAFERKARPPERTGFPDRLF